MVRFIEENEWQKTDSKGAVDEGSVAIITLHEGSLGAIPANEMWMESPEDRPLQLMAAHYRDSEWLVWPLNLVEQEFFPPIDPVAAEIERRKEEIMQSLESLKEEFPDEPWVPLPRVLRSPFLEASEKLKEEIDVCRRSDEDTFTYINLSGDLLPYLEEIDDFFKKVSRGERAEPPKMKEEIDHPWTLFGQRSDRGSEICTIPNLGELTPKEVALYLVITGEIESAVPLRIARAVLNEDFDWNFTLSEISQLGPSTSEIPEIPKSGFLISGLCTNKNKLVATQDQYSGESSHLELANDWRERSKPVMWWLPNETTENGWEVAPEIDGRSGHSRNKNVVLSGLMRYENRFVWWSGKPISPDVSIFPNIVSLQDLAAPIQQCLALWRDNIGEPTDGEYRLERWLNSRQTADPLVAHICEGIVTEFVPWPDPFHTRLETDEAWSWSRARCLKQVLPLFEVLANAPLRHSPHALVANFLYLIESNRLVCHAWPHKFQEAWNFKLKTQDHSWIGGEILVEPGQTLPEASGKSLRMEVHPDTQIWGFLECGPVKCVIM